MVNNPCPVPTTTRNIPIFTLFAANSADPIITVIPPLVSVSWLRRARIPIGNNTNTKNYPAV